MPKSIRRPVDGPRRVVHSFPGASDWVEIVRWEEPRYARRRRARWQAIARAVILAAAAALLWAIIALARQGVPRRTDCPPGIAMVFVDHARPATPGRYSG